MGLRDIGASLPPGFRFYPSDEELVCHYLYKKITKEQLVKGTLMEIDLHTCEPWQLPEVTKLNANEWYFFSFRDRKYATGFRTNRATTSGYWKATGKDRTIHDPITREVVGMRKTLVFYQNRAPNGIKTGWIMHEFRLETPHIPPKEDWVLCRVFHKSKGEDNNAKKSPEFMLELEHTPPCLTLASSSPNSQNMPSGYDQITSFSSLPAHHDQNLNQNSNSLLNLLQFSRETNSTTSTQISPKDHEDDYGFLWDIDLEGNSLENGLVDEMRFNIDHNSMIFL
ncbi:NAC domain protein [Quillaja saponaria]|uniref:NAC domain protein n=1 Tax=Quillaja saponaria TaxID=32244 RepID=A0AAD7VEF4_QUISA|nr:NAC domain protein [Quillaja saponaria]